MNSTNSKILVWDTPVRVFHWLMVLSFAGAYLSAESERWRLAHVSLGYTLGGLVAFRILWGILGTRHARFSNFIRGPKAVTRYLRSLITGNIEHHTGHNPAGAVAIALMLLLSAGITATGWAMFNDMGPGWLEEIHESFANTMLMVAGIHVAGVFFSSLMHHENLVRTMVTGYKNGPPSEAIAYRWRPLAALIVAAVLTFWWMQWQSAPKGEPVTGATSSTKAAYEKHDRDDD